jgi:hypothetical protein
MVFSRAYRSVDAYLSARITSRGLYMSDFAVLEALLHKGALTVAVIAEKVGMGEVRSFQGSIVSRRWASFGAGVPAARTASRLRSS